MILTLKNFHFFLVSLGSHQAKGTRGHQVEVHRYQLQVWSRSLPDTRGQERLHGPAQEAQGEDRSCRRCCCTCCSYHSLNLRILIVYFSQKFSENNKLKILKYGLSISYLFYSGLFHSKVRCL